MDSQRSVANSIWISLDEPAAISDLLRKHHWLAAGEEITSVERAGDGNMNCTLRVTTERQSLIVKQARPWVEKYPSIAAPVNRATFERQFYETVSSVPVLADRMPDLIGADAKHHMLILEDLGQARDGTALYHVGWSEHEHRPILESLVAWLAALHRETSASDPQHRTAHANRELRALNHAHIFDIPFQSPGSVDLDSLTPGLEAVASRTRQCDTMLARCEALGNRYLADGDCLLHGDFFPGSWLLCAGGPKVIDPEFSFYGEPEFDVGVLVGHLRMVGASPPVATKLVVDGYEHQGRQLDHSLVHGWAGIEILRRLMGVAQLPVNWSLATKTELINDAIRWIV